jgi:hypothetical protein
MARIIRSAIASDLEGILDLQSQNLYANIAASALAGGGSIPIVR